jgi:multidrug efflux system membrane fusion protein
MVCETTRGGRGGLGFLLCGALVLLLGCQGRAASAPAVRPVAVRRPLPSACSDAPRFSGNVEPLVRVDLAFKRGGYVERVLEVPDGPGRRLLEQGDAVRRGQVLVALRDGDYRAKLQQAQAQLAQVRAAERQAVQDLERARALQIGEAISRAAYEGIEARAQAAQAQAQAAAAVVDEATLAVEDCALRAPLDAQVIRRTVEVGSLVGPGTPGVILADTRSMKVVFGVPDLMLARVRPGTAVEVTILDARRRGKVSRVAPAADPQSRLFDVEVILPNADAALRVGMIAALRLSGDAPAAGALAVPLSAVVRPPGETTGFAVFVAAGGALAMRRVELGELCGDQVEIRAGLAADAQVVVDGAAGAHDGERVAVRSAEPETAANP